MNNIHANPMAIWWEKTVEYKFILDAAVKRKINFAAPLSGLQERLAGDGIFGVDSKLILVEFKRSSAELNSDKGKFTGYLNAAQELGARDSHHFFVYGGLDTAGNCGGLCLHACTYFSRIPITGALGILDKGIEPSLFNEYLSDLIAYRKEDRRSSGGMFSPESVSSVVGVSPSGTMSISLSEYVRQKLPDLYLKSGQEMSLSPGF